MGFTQRQAAGKFTRDEASALIDQLQEAESGGAPPPAPRPTASSSVDDRLLRRMPAEALATELERRGWIVIGP
jgi:hypothetical protein